MLKTRFDWAILIILTAFLGSAWIVMSREPAAESRGFTLAEAPLVGHLAPDFTLTNSAGKPVALGDHVSRAGEQGQPVVLNFWASWCAPCRVEMPHLQKISQEYNGRAVVLGVNQGESLEIVRDFGDEFEIRYPLLVDADSRVSRLYHVTGLPTTVFIGRDGTIREVVLGIVNQAVLEDRIERLLRESGG